MALAKQISKPSGFMRDLGYFDLETVRNGVSAAIRHGSKQSHVLLRPKTNVCE
jgi:hypothetical protein